LARRLGYRKPTRGKRKIETFLNGDFDNPFLRRRLTETLGIPEPEFEEALAESRRVLAARAAASRAEAEARWRKDFQPHGLILTDERRPRSILAFSFGAHPEYVPLDGIPERSWVETMLEAIAERRLPGGRLPLWGRITGFVINHTPDHATRYDLSGRPIEVLDRALRLGVATLEIDSRKIPVEKLASPHS